MAIFAARSFTWSPSNRSYGLRYGAAICLAVLLAGCGGAQTQPGTVPATVSQATREAAGSDLVYLSNEKTNQVDFFSYPQGKKLGAVTELGQPRSECADKAGNVWIDDIQGYDVVEYAHGGTAPITAISTSGPPQGCAINPKNGDLAVTGGVGGIVLSVFHQSEHGIWRDARTYTYAAMQKPKYCSFDAHGNLFVDGTGPKGSGFVLAELANGASALAPVAVSQQIAAPGQVQWDGQYLAIGDSGAVPSMIYQFSISGGTASEVGSTTLSSTSNIAQFWIQGSAVVGPDRGGSVGFYPYPAGGQAAKTISGFQGYGAAVSLAQ